MKTFGASAPLKVLQKEFGFTTGHVVEAAKAQLAQVKMNMRVAVASDHAGFSLKETVLVYLRGLGHTWKIWALVTRPVDYPDFAEAVAIAVLSQRVERAVLICGSGVGASVAANKFRGIRAGLCHDTYSAHQGVEHDHMNCWCWVVG